MKRLSLLLFSVLLMTSLASGCTTQTVNDDLTTDIVIIGAGGAGLAAAITAADAGKNVIIVEKMPIIGGNTLRATGGMNAAGTSSQMALGIVDSADTHFEDTMKGGRTNDAALVRVFADQAAEAVEWLIELGADLSDVGRLGGSSNNRSHRPTGGAPVGAHLVDVLTKAARARDVTILTNTEAVEILIVNDIVTGIKVKDANKEYSIFANAVIVATGGFGADAEQIGQLDPSLIGFGTTNHPGANASGINMAVAIGAATVDMTEIQTHPTVEVTSGEMITEAVRGNGAIIINMEGKRFVNELGTRDVVSEAILSQTDKTSFLLFRDEVRASLSAIEGYIKKGIVEEFETIEALADKFGVTVEVMQETIDSYNGFVESKIDTEFARSDMPRLLAEGSFYTIQVGPAVHHTMGGLKTNTEAQVLHSTGNPIQGLFAAGEATGGLHGQNRLGGNALADLIIYGRIAGANASK
jgi:fumarate reductase flavoprotein subunit